MLLLLFNQSRILNQSVTAASSGTVSVIKSVARTFLASCVGAVTAGAIKVHIVIVNVLSSGAVALSRSISKIAAVSSTGAVSIKKAIAHSVSVASTGTVSAIKSIAKKVAATAVGAVSVVASFVPFGAGVIYNVTVNIASSGVVRWVASFFAKSKEAQPRSSTFSNLPREY